MVASFKSFDDVEKAVSRFVEKSEGKENFQNAQESAEMSSRDLVAQIKADKLALHALKGDSACPTITYLNALIKIVNPSSRLVISYPKPGIVAIMDEQGNTVLINAAEDVPSVETVGSVNTVRHDIFDLGDADDVDWVFVTNKRRRPKFST